MSSDERCEVCRYWSDYAKRIGGVCRRRSPQIHVVIQGDASSIGSDVLSGWPSTDRNDWCGEFERKEADDG